MKWLTVSGHWINRSLPKYYTAYKGGNRPTGKSALLIIIRNDTIFIYFNCLISKENTRSMNGVYTLLLDFWPVCFSLFIYPKGKCQIDFSIIFSSTCILVFYFKVWYKVIANLLFYMKEHVSTFYTISHDFRFQV